MGRTKGIGRVLSYLCWRDKLESRRFSGVASHYGCFGEQQVCVPKMPRRRPSLALSPCPAMPPTYRGNRNSNLRTVTPSSFTGTGHNRLPRIPRRRSTIQCATEKDASVSPTVETTAETCCQDSSPKVPVHWPTVVGKYMELDGSANDNHSILTEDDVLDMATNSFCPTSRPRPNQESCLCVAEDAIPTAKRHQRQQRLCL